jgi:hypothetical protein
MYAASVENEAIGSHVVIPAELAYFKTSGAAGAAVGASVAAGACVATDACVAAGVVPPHALKSTDNVTKTENNTDNLFIGSPLWLVELNNPTMTSLQKVCNKLADIITGA